MNIIIILSIFSICNLYLSQSYPISSYYY